MSTMNGFYGRLRYDSVTTNVWYYFDIMIEILGKLLEVLMGMVSIFATFIGVYLILFSPILFLLYFMWMMRKLNEKWYCPNCNNKILWKNRKNFLLPLQSTHNECPNCHTKLWFGDKKSRRFYEWVTIAGATASLIPVIIRAIDFEKSTRLTLVLFFLLLSLISLIFVHRYVMKQNLKSVPPQ